MDNIESLDKKVSLNLNEATEYIKQLNNVYAKPSTPRYKTFENKNEFFVSSFYLKRDVFEGEKLNFKDLKRLRNCDGNLCNTFNHWKSFNDKTINKFYLKDMKKGDRLNNGDFRVDV